MHTRKHGLIRVAGVLSFGILITLSYLFVNPTTINSGLTTLVYAEGNDTPATSGTPFPSLVTLNIDLTHPNASVELTPHDNTGTFSSSSEDNSVAFNVSTNNYSGYTLYISSSSNDGYLSPASITTPTTENSLSSIDEIITESDFSNPSSTTLNNKWGYKPSKYNGSDNTSFIPAPSIINPTTRSDILDTTTTYNTTTNGDPITTETNTEDIDANTYTIALGARVDSTIPTGSYEGTFVLQVVGNPVPVTITYTDTSGDNTVTSTLPSIYHGELSDTEAPISTTTPTRTGYTFKSWCLGEVTAGTETNNYVDTCTGTTYNPSTTENTQYIGVDLTHSNTMTLVAMWERNKYSLTINFAGSGVSSVQVRTASGTGGTLVDTVSTSGGSVSNLVYGTNYYLYPSFSSNYEFSSWAKTSGEGTLSSTSVSNPTYTIGAGNGTVTITGKASCQSSISGTMQTFDPSKLCSNVTSGTLTDARGDNQTYEVAKLADGKWWMLENLRLGGTSTIALTSSNTNMTASSWTLPASTTGFTGSEFTPAAINADSKTTTQPLAAGQSGTGKVGVYYNFCAATVGTYCYAEGSGTGNASPDNDICPKKWRMPTGGDSSEYQALRNKYSSNGALVTALKTPLSGYYNYGDARGVGSDGNFWSSTRENSNYMYILRVDKSDADPKRDSNRRIGISVRCLFK